MKSIRRCPCGSRCPAWWGAPAVASITTRPLPGHQLGFLGDGGSQFEPGEAGCTFRGVQRGHSNFCQIQVENQETSLTVFKRWIGTSEPFRWFIFGAFGYLVLAVIFWLLQIFVN